MRIALGQVEEHLLQGNVAAAWALVAPVLAASAKAERVECGLQLMVAVREDMGAVDPIVQELFCARVDMAIKRVRAAQAALERAERWRALQARAEAEGLDLNNLPAMYRHLGATDFQEYKEGKSRSRGAKALLNEDTVSYLVMAQQMEKVLPVLEHFSQASWLTVGDGRHAFEARFLMKHGACVLASNFDVTLLKEAQELGYIETYACENLERLSFADDSFDFVCCKDTLHHLLRPYLGLYEMLRVAREGIFIIEPFDHAFFASAICQTRKDKTWHHFEKEAGNYAYSFSERELEKLCVSHGWRCLAVRGISTKDGDGIDGLSTDPEELRRQRERVEAREQAAMEGKAAWSNQASLLLKRRPSGGLRTSLEKAGYAVLDLPCNPHTRRAVFLNLEKRYSRL